MKYVITILLSLSAWVFGQEEAPHSFTLYGSVNGKKYSTVITSKYFGQQSSSNLLTIDGDKVIWTYPAKVTLAQAGKIAIPEAKKILGAKHADNWTLRSAGRRQVTSNGKHIHFYHFSFSPKRMFRAEKGNLQLVVLLDGSLLPCQARGWWERFR